jgi:dihydropyrimidine dehydrogenase (NAD+) subunit PreA
MTNLATQFAGISCPNPFWLASGPPTDKEYNVSRALAAGWGGVVWKTVVSDPPRNISGPRYGSRSDSLGRVLAMNNVELISDRPLATNLAEITRVRAAWPDRALVVSVMAPCEEQPWADLLGQVAQTGADAVELNLSCPHGMNERGMGSAVGQVPELVAQVTTWAKRHSPVPVLVKLTPNITDIRLPARAAADAGADGISLINTINSIMGVDLDSLTMVPATAGKGTHGGYCGPAVKPIALSMLSEVARDPQTRHLQLSGIGGICQWSDAAEFIALGAGTVQVCSAAMVHGFRIVADMIDGLARYLDRTGLDSVADLRGRALPSVTTWAGLDIEATYRAHIDPATCIGCGRCYLACEDTAHQAIDPPGPQRLSYQVRTEDCVGCNLCVCVCPIPGAVSLRPAVSAGH